MSTSVVERLGGATLRQLGYVGGLAIQLRNALGALGQTLPLVGNRRRWKSALQQMLAVGVDAFPIARIMAACPGLIPATQGPSEPPRIVALPLVIDLVTPRVAPGPGAPRS